MAKPTLFIGSSSEGLDVAEAVQVSLGQECEVTLWTQGVFLLGLSYLESLTRVLGDYDFAVLVLTPDDMVSSRGMQKTASRDNVIFELGLFMGAIGRNRAFALVDKSADLRIPSDLSGISLAAYTPHSSGNTQASVGVACTQIKRSIRQLGRKNNNKPSVFKSVDSPKLFGIGTDLLSRATQRVALVAKTPILITGPRPFGETVQYPWETKQFACLEKLLCNARDGSKLDFRCIASLAKLKEDLTRGELVFSQNVSGNLSMIFEAISRPSSRISLRWSRDKFPMTYLVVDDYFMLWFKDADDKFCLWDQDLRIANALWKQASVNSDEFMETDVQDKLGLHNYE